MQRKIVDAYVQRPEGWEVGRQSLDIQLVQVLGLGEILQPVLAEVPDAHTWRKSLFDQRVDAVRDDDLPAVPAGGNPRRAMHVQADVVGRDDATFSCMKAHPHAHPRIA